MYANLIHDAGMLEELIAKERNFFFLLNGSDSITMDYFMYLYSYKFTWIPFFICLFLLFLKKYQKDPKECILLFLSIFVLLLLCDRVTSGLIKPIFESLRPTHHPDYKDLVDTVLGYRGGRFGFASSHAANIFGFAFFSAFLVRKRYFSLLIYLHALLTIYTRIYLGVHFITDVTAGALIGTIIAIPVLILYLLMRNFVRTRDNQPVALPVYSYRDIRCVFITYFATIIILLVFNNQLIKFIT
ncbi:MAG: phosphatase PAP2 family protein [Dysgonamonadaceae bacterium]|nr:phosphatase PAP2 family protein [Dysgonamonadaceae bacterium]